MISYCVTDSDFKWILNSLKRAVACLKANDKELMPFSEEIIIDVIHYIEDRAEEIKD